MEFWNEFTKTVNHAADKTVKGAEKLTGIAKVKYKISSINSKLDSCYKNIGELKYAEKCGEEVTENMYSALFEQVDEYKKELKELEDKLSDIREYQTCKMCGYRIQKGLPYCPKCGEKLASEIADEQSSVNG